MCPYCKTKLSLSFRIGGKYWIAKCSNCKKQFEVRKINFEGESQVFKEIKEGG